MSPSVFSTFPISHGGSGDRSLWWSQFLHYCLHAVICEGGFPIVLLNYPRKYERWLNIGEEIRYFRRPEVCTYSIRAIPLCVVQSVRHFVHHFDSTFLGQRHHSFVSTQAVGFCVVLIGQFGDFPLAEQLWKHFLWLPSYNKEPGGAQHTTIWPFTNKVSAVQAFNSVLSLQTKATWSCVSWG